MNFVMFVCLSACISAVPVGRIFEKFDIGYVYGCLSNPKFSENLTTISGTVREGRSTFLLSVAV
jgi:hypothetical protein